MNSSPRSSDTPLVSGTGEIVEQAQEHLASWSRARLVRHGFEHFACTDQRGADARRQHARTVLAGDHVVAELIAGFGAVLVKGREVACLYPSPTMRHFRDIDVISPDPHALWQHLTERGARHNPMRRGDIDHHHLPALKLPGLPVTVEVHVRANSPGWMPIPTDLIVATGQPSRTGIAGITRPRDDVHALIVAGHAWKSGFSRMRDLLDVLLLEAVAGVPVETTARDLGMGAMWRLTRRLAASEILGRDDPRVRRLSRLALQANAPIERRSRNRLVLPYLVAGPVRVSRSHWREYQLGRAARRSPQS